MITRNIVLYNEYVTKALYDWDLNFGTLVTKVSL